MLFMLPTKLFITDKNFLAISPLEERFVSLLLLVSLCKPEMNCLSGSHRQQQRVGDLIYLFSVGKIQFLSPTTRWMTGNKQNDATYFNGNINSFT